MPPLLEGFMNEDVYTGCVENMRLPGSNLLFGGGGGFRLSSTPFHSSSHSHVCSFSLFTAARTSHRSTFKKEGDWRFTDLTRLLYIYTPRAAAGVCCGVLIPSWVWWW